MNTKDQVIIASLLHDIGKLVMRAGGTKITHQLAGIEFIKEQKLSFSNDSKILNAIKYHHAEELKNANLPDDDISFIIYEADNISAAIDRRENDENLKGFNLSSPLFSVFNVLNQNNQRLGYELKVLKKENPVIKLIPGDEIKNDLGRYSIVKDELIASLSKMGNTMSPNTLLRLLELTTGFIPSSTNREEQIDISLFNHLKTTAMIATNIYDYFVNENINNYKEKIIAKKEEFRKTNVHLLLKADISGIQNFIYKVPNEDALKNLRARSFYLELLTENILDELLDILELSRSNLIYSGGGAFQILIPNTEKNKKNIDKFVTEVNSWIIKQYKEKLYIAINYVECSANDLANDMSSNNKDRNYLGEKHRELSLKLNYRKINRYTQEELIELYGIKNVEHERECDSCKTSSVLLKEVNKCFNCQALINIGQKLNKVSEVFCVITDEIINDTAIEMFALRPNKCFLNIIVDSKTVEELLAKKKIKRLYTVNQDSLSLNYATDIMYGCNENNLTLNELANLSDGDKLLGVLRIDVDQLSNAFISGFSRDNQTDFRYNTISRSTSLSNLLNIFFKAEIRKLAKKKFSFSPIKIKDIKDEKEQKEYQINIIYSGGDDVFAVGAWDDLLEFAININKEFKLFSADTLTLSAGFSMFKPSTPILAIANIVGELESFAKDSGRNSICLFSGNYVFKWEEFEEKVLSKVNKFYEWFSNSGEKDKMQFSTSFYKLRMLISQDDTDVNKAKNLSKIVYAIAKLQEGCSNQTCCDDFAKTVLSWSRTDKERKYLDIAMMVVIYLNRKEVK